jgi:hypothetical protein
MGAISAWSRANSSEKAKSTPRSSPSQNDESREIARDWQAHVRKIEARDRGSDGFFAYTDQERRQIIEETTVEMIIGKGYQHVRMRIFEDLPCTAEAGS